MLLLKVKNYCVFLWKIISFDIVLKGLSHSNFYLIKTFLFSEETGYDLCCVVSCLAQMLMDPEYRTREGFSALVQREWVVMGHPFQRRNHLVRGPESEQVSLSLNCSLRPHRLMFRYEIGKNSFKIHTSRCVFCL